MKHILILLFFFVFSYSSFSQAVEAVTNINYYGGDAFNPQEITVCNGSLFFYGTTQNDSFYNNLFISDGTMSGTIMIKRIDSNQGYYIGGLTPLSNKLIFAYSYSQNSALWSSDGTASGTQSFAPVVTHTNYSPSSLEGPKFVELNNKLYFGGGDTANGQNQFNLKDQLWVTDGTAAGTMLVKTINPNGAAGIEYLYPYNGKIYFSATDGVHGKQLWISDGTAAGTTLLKSLNTSSTYLEDYIPYNGKLYFSAYDSVSSTTQMAVTDGTPGGTNLVTSFQNFNFSSPIVYNNKIYFNGWDSTGTPQLWSSDGTAAGTSIIHAEPNGFNPISFTICNGSLYMLGSDSAYGTEVWKSDGTAAGTHIITHAVTTQSFEPYPTNLMALNNNLVFVGWDTAAGIPNIFVSDGTEAGSHSYGLPGEYNTDFRATHFTPFNNAIYYNASYFTTLDYQVDKVVLNTVGIDEVSTNNFAVYPNPTRDYLQIKSDQHLASVEISDISGRVIMSTVLFAENRIATSALAVGVYIIRATEDDGQTHTAKFVKE